MKGKFLKTIGNGGLGNAVFKVPNGIAIDKTGHLVVADFKRVQVLTLEGLLVAKFGEGKLSFGDGVSVLKDGRITVTDYDNHQFLVFG